MLTAGFMKEIERSDIISTCYLSEIDEALVSTLNLCPSFVIGVFMVLDLSGALVVRHPNVIKWIFHETADALAVHGLIFRFICDDIQQQTLRPFIYSFIAPDSEDATLLFDFLLNPQRSQHHAVGSRTHNSITERCFSYILNRRLAHFPGIHHWARKSKRRPWLWRRRKPKGVITNHRKVRWRQKEHVGYDKRLDPFSALVLALKYLPYLLDKATESSEELIALAEMWSHRYHLPASLFPRDTKKARKAVEHYLFRFDGKEHCGSDVAVGPALLCNV